MITGLYSNMVTLLKDTSSKFIVDEDYLPPSKSLKPIHKLQKLELNKPFRRQCFHIHLLRKVKVFDVLKSFKIILDQGALLEEYEILSWINYSVVSLVMDVVFQFFNIDHPGKKIESYEKFKYQLKTV